jgi:hypothetical protein
MGAGIASGNIGWEGARAEAAEYSENELECRFGGVIFGRCAKKASGLGCENKSVDGGSTLDLADCFEWPAIFESVPGDAEKKTG